MYGLSSGKENTFFILTRSLVRMYGLSSGKENIFFILTRVLVRMYGFTRLKRTGLDNLCYELLFMQLKC